MIAFDANIGIPAGIFPRKSADRIPLKNRLLRRDALITFAEYFLRSCGAFLQV
jgi:hypothetical protein